MCPLQEAHLQHREPWQHGPSTANGAWPGSTSCLRRPSALVAARAQPQVTKPLFMSRPLASLPWTRQRAQSSSAAQGCWEGRSRLHGACRGGCWPGWAGASCLRGSCAACLWAPVKARGPLPRSLLEKELESVGIRLNKHKPNIYFKVRPIACRLRGWAGWGGRWGSVGCVRQELSMWVVAADPYQQLSFPFSSSPRKAVASPLIRQSR